MNKIKISLLAAALFTSATALADPTLLSDDFNAPAWQGGGLLVDDTSDNWAHTSYYFANATGGWSINGGTYLASDDQGNGAILLNENGPGQLWRNVGGMTVGQSYTLTFDVWGDNRPGQAYGVDVTVGGNTTSYTGTDQSAGFFNGSNGAHQSITFTADAENMLLAFAQTTPQGSAASPIIDNVNIAAVPEPETYGMLLAGLALVGLARRRAR